MGWFDEPLPAGFRYEDDFLAPDDAAALAARIAGLTFANFEMRGVVARRRVAFFGEAYDEARAASPWPDFLAALRDRVAAWAGLAPAAFVMALVNEYRPG